MAASDDGARVWHAVAIEIDAQFADAVGSFLLDRGAPGLEIEDLGGRVVVTGHFTESGVAAEVEEYAGKLAPTGDAGGRPIVRHTVIAESDWAESWKSHFPPLEIGARLFVHPPWIAEIPPGRVGIEIDPGMAFGTGHHASTQGCLAALDSLVDAAQAPSVLDLGTGSGVLAIAAVKLGARCAVAIDVDPVACEIAVANARRNGVVDTIEVATQSAAERSGFDIVVANILSGTLIAMAEDIARRVRHGGIVIGSGIEEIEADAVTTAWTAAGLSYERAYRIETWTTLVFRRP